MNKHGVEHFAFETIYESNDRYDTLINKEPHFIEIYNAYTKGYNCNKGGYNTNTDKMRKSSSERMKADNPMTKLRHNSGTFKKGQIGIKWTDDRKKKMSNSKKEKIIQISAR